MLTRKIDQEFAFVQTAMNLRARRQEIIAANIANADTPNYKARDLDFAAALRAAMGGAGGPVRLARTAPGHLEGARGELAGGAVKYRAAVQPSIDGNTVDLNVERAHFAENAVHYQFLLERAGSQIRSLSKALESR